MLNENQLKQLKEKVLQLLLQEEASELQYLEQGCVVKEYDDYVFVWTEDGEPLRREISEDQLKEWLDD